MTEHALHVFAVLKLLFVFVEIGTKQAHRWGLCAAWWARNLARFVTLVFGASVYIEHDWHKLNAFCFATGLLLWNRPKDGEPPKRRRRRKQEKKETRLQPNWSGLPEAV